MKQKPIQCDLIPVKSLPTPWDGAFHFAQASYLRLELNNEPLEIRMSLADFHWRIILHWVIKLKWRKKHKIPVPKKVAEGWEPFGRLMRWLLELCIQCHSDPCVKPFGYATAAGWFTCVVWEWKLEGMEQALREKNKKGGKREHQNEFQQDLNSLRRGENPYNPKKTPHTHRLIEVARQHKESSENFCEECWKPLLDAYRDWIIQLAKPETHAIQEDEKGIYLHKGQGRYRKRIYLVSWSPTETVVQL